MGMSLYESKSFAFSRILNGTSTNPSCVSSSSFSSSTFALDLHSFYCLLFFFVVFPQNIKLWSKGRVRVFDFLRETFPTMSPCIPPKRERGETSPLEYPRPTNMGSMSLPSQTCPRITLYLLLCNNYNVNHECQVKSTLT